MKPYFTILLFVLSSQIFAQNKITGKVYDADDKKPLPNANVFINNATNGNQTNADGQFTLKGVKDGQYDLIVSMVGYQTFKYTVTVKGDVTVPDIFLELKNNVLADVKITIPKNRGKYLDMFKKEILGHSGNAYQCEIINPDVVYVTYDEKEKTLSASTTDFMVVENKALGYRLKYLVEDFEMSKKKNTLSYIGYAQFEELKGDLNDERRWKKNRLAAYLGSAQHFLKAIIADDLTKQGFEVYGAENKPLILSDFIHRTDQKNIWAINYPTNITVNYNPYGTVKGNSYSIKALTVRQTTGTAKKETVLIFNEPNAFFDINGIITNPVALRMDGIWGFQRLADLLPVDYNPETNN